ncbi:MAG: serine/threonine protein kinase [Deltaproteobacteria bacterium]|nr:serine/threonine protein kinase [Deltaproteobacteria bacterium]
MEQSGPLASGEGWGGTPDPRIGETIGGQYFLEHLLGRGGMGSVYRAQIVGSDRQAVVKLLRSDLASDPSVARRFHQEAQAAARVVHPSSIRLLGSGSTDDGTPYLAMEYVPGRTLARAIAEEWPLGDARVVELGAQVLAALAAAHACGVVHRDLKPANVMLRMQEGRELVTVLDFGIAQLVGGGEPEARITHHGTIYGTPAYMSPEQARGEALDPRSDLYSVGVLLYEALAGVLPFEAPTVLGVLARHAEDELPPIRTRRPAAIVAPALEAVVAWALRKQREDRPASAEEMRNALLACGAGAPGGRRPLPRVPEADTLALPAQYRLAGPGPGPGSGRMRRVSGRAAGAGVALAMLLALGTAILGWQGSRAGAAAVPPGAAPAPERAAEAALPPVALPQPSTSGAPPAMQTSPPGGDRARELPGQARTARVARRTDPPPKAPTAIRTVAGQRGLLPTPPPTSGEALLVLDALPWAEVSVDGEPLGETPREVRLAAGRHAVRAIHPEYGAREVWIQVEAGERRVWTAAFGP